MELRVLRYFLAIAREETIVGAAEAMHVTQPTLSRQIMDLEDELGKQLLIRGSRKITLTNEGMLLRKRAEEIIQLVERTKSEVCATDEVVAGHIFIGGGETKAMHLIARVIHKFQKEYPQVHYHLFSGNAEEVTERLEQGLLDFGILIAPSDVSRYDYITLPIHDTWGVLLRKDHPLALQKSIRSQDLENEPLLISRQAHHNNELAGWFNGNYHNLNFVATYNLIYNASFLVEEGSGSALCLDKLIDSFSSSLCFRPLDPPLTASLVLVWKKHQTFPRAVELFMRRLQKEFCK